MSTFHCTNYGILILLHTEVTCLCSCCACFARLSLALENFPRQVKSSEVGKSSQVEANQVMSNREKSSKVLQNFYVCVIRHTSNSRQ